MSKIHTETDRLILREIDPERDFEAWAACFSEESTMRFLGSPPLNRADAWRNMCVVIGHWQVRGYGFFSLEEKATGAWVGRAGPWNPEGWPAPEVGWTIAPEHRRKGFAAEAGAASVAYAFDTLGWDSVLHVILKGNDGSVATAEKIGSCFQREQVGLPGITSETVLVYGQTR